MDGVAEGVLSCSPPEHETIQTWGHFVIIINPRHVAVGLTSLTEDKSIYFIYQCTHLRRTPPYYHTGSWLSLAALAVVWCVSSLHFSVVPSVRIGWCQPLHLLLGGLGLPFGNWGRGVQHWSFGVGWGIYFRCLISNSVVLSVQRRSWDGKKHMTCLWHPTFVMEPVIFILKFVFEGFVGRLGYMVTGW